MMSYVAVLLSLCVCASSSVNNLRSAAVLPRVKGVDGRFFVDEFGRVMIFHGFNDVGEETKRVGPFDG